jgi:NAD(P)-dependent dehydrogenase (short-subunit alcohol dehydrogenase family)
MPPRSALRRFGTEDVMQIEGNVAIVTGGASGLGEATARHLHARGATVVLFDRDAERAAAITAELGGRAAFVAGSVLSEEDTLHAIEVAQGFGPYRILVACAGGATGGGRTVDRDGTPHSLELFRSTIDLNVVGTFNSLRLSAAAMAAQEPENEDGERGVVIATASIAGFEGQIGQIAYGSAKAAIIGMTLIAARDLSATGIRVNTIAPGTMFTRAWDKAPAALRDKLESKVPFPQRFGRPEEFAELAEHMITNRYLNAQVVRLDGGIRFDPK